MTQHGQGGPRPDTVGSVATFTPRRPNPAALTQPESSAPLAGIRILAVEQYGAGPFGSLYLAELGAEVIKIEDPGAGGDVSRYIPPGAKGSDSLFFETFNRGKRSIVLDLKSAAGRSIFQRLAQTADAVISNLRGDQTEALGLTYEQLAQFNAAIVCVALTGYGRSGSQAALPGYDALIQAEAGWATLTGAPGDPPTKSGLSLADYIAGLTAALGLVVAVFDAQRTGQGRNVDTNLYDSALAMLTYPATWFLSANIRTERQPLSGHPSVVPFQFFETADGWIAVATPKEKFFLRLAEGLELPGLPNDARFSGFEARRQHREELVAIMAARFRSRTTNEWLQRLSGRVPIAPVRTFEAALDLDELRGRSMLTEYDHPTLGPVRSMSLPISMDRFVSVARPGPSLGGDMAEVLTELGYTTADVDRLRTDGAFGTWHGDDAEPATHPTAAGKGGAASERDRAQ